MHLRRSVCFESLGSDYTLRDNVSKYTQRQRKHRKHKLANKHSSWATPLPACRPAETQLVESETLVIFAMAEPPCRLFLKNVLAQYTPADLEAELWQRGLGYGLLHIHPVRKVLSKYPVVAEAARPRTDGAVYPVNLAPVAPAAPIVGSQAKSASGPPSWRGAAAGHGAAGRGTAGHGAASPSGCGRRGPVDLVPPAPPPPPAPPAPPAPPPPPAPPSPLSDTLETEEMEEETVQRCTHDDYMVDPTEDADDSDDLPSWACQA